MISEGSRVSGGERAAECCGRCRALLSESRSEGESARIQPRRHFTRYSNLEGFDMTFDSVMSLLISTELRK